MKLTRRQLNKLLLLLPLANSRAAERDRTIEDALGDDYVIVDGWILKKSDLPDLLK
jgi:hypothetical protein